MGGFTYRISTGRRAMLNKRQRLGRRERVKIFIGGVPAATTDRDLELFLRQGGGQRSPA